MERSGKPHEPDKDPRRRIREIFVDMLFKKDGKWILGEDEAFEIVRAKASGIFFRQPVIFGLPEKSSEDLYGCLDLQNVLEAFECDRLCVQAKKREFSARFVEIMRVPLSSLQDAAQREYVESIYGGINIEKSRIYIIPDIEFPDREHYFETLFRIGKDGRITKERKEKDCREDTRQIRGHAS